MKVDCISQFLAVTFKKLGSRIAKKPLHFIIFPVVVSLILASGLLKITVNNNIEYILKLDNSEVLKQREIIKKLFPLNFNCDLGRELVDRVAGSVIITARDKGSILRHHIFEQILRVDEDIRNLTIGCHIKQCNYEDLCVRCKKKCFGNQVLLIKDRIFKGTNYTIKYPIEKDQNANVVNVYAGSFGKVEIDKEDNLLSAKAVRLFYLLEDDTEEKRQLKKLWEVAFREKLTKEVFQHIQVDIFSFSVYESELDHALARILPFLCISIPLVLVFSVVTCLKEDCIQSKPWTGAISASCAGLAIASAFGVISYCGVPFNVAAAVGPFLILGVAMDDTFVLLAAWRRTDRNRSVEERLGEAYSESAVAITVTSLTNFISFVSGVFAPIWMIKIFSVYVSTAIFLCYIYQLTFVGGCMAICGRMEKEGRHSFIFLPLKNEKGNNGKCVFTNGKWTSGKIYSCMKFNVWKKLGNVLTHWPVKVLTFLTFSCSLAVCCWSITKLKYVTEFRTLPAYDSYVVPYLDKIFDYFYLNSMRIQFIIDEELNYADPLVQQRVEKFLTQIENMDIIADSVLTESWLRYYLKFLKDPRLSASLEHYNITNNEDFIKILRTLFLRHPTAKRFAQDIAFNHNYTSIIGSRFLCQTSIVRNSEDSYFGIRELKNLMKEAPFSAFSYHFYDAIREVSGLNVSTTVKVVSTIIAAISVICILLIASFKITISVTLTVLFIETSVIGYLVLWDVKLDSLTMIVFLVCAGLSVNYSAHISYAYKISKFSEPNERMQDAINSVGKAVFQGSGTTLLSILPLAYPVSKVFVVCFKVGFLQIVFSFLCGVIFLPVIFSTLDSLSQTVCRRRKEISISVMETDNKHATGVNINPAFVHTGD